MFAQEPNAVAAAKHPANSRHEKNKAVKKTTFFKPFATRQMILAVTDDYSRKQLPPRFKKTRFSKPSLWTRREPLNN